MGGRRGTRRSLTIVVVAVALLLPALAAGADPPVRAAIPTGADTMSAIVGLRTTTGRYAAPIDIAVMPSGKVFLLGVDSATYPTTVGQQDHVAFEISPDPVGATLPATTPSRRP